jgi:hypothetical protein
MRNSEPRDHAAVYAIVLWLVADALMAVSGGLNLMILADTARHFSDSALRGAGHVATLTIGFYGIASVICGACVGRWIYRANAKAHSVSDSMTISAFWSVGSFFVPVANLFLPYWAMRETWQVSIAPTASRDVPVPSIMRIWWGLWVLRNVLGNDAFRFYANASTKAEFVWGSGLNIVVFFADIPIALLFLAIIRQLGANQRALVDTGIFE